MAYRFLVGLLLAATLSACFDDGHDASGSTQAYATSSASGATVTASTITLQNMPLSSATVGVHYTYQPTVPEKSEVVTFAIAGQPSWASFDASTGVLSGTPSINNVGLSANIVIIASNGSNLGSAGPFTIRVNTSPAGSPDAAPVISGTPGTQVGVGQSYTFQPQASDPAGRPLSYGIYNRPIWATFDTATGRLSGTPNSAQAGDYSGIGIYVTDGTTGASLLPQFTIHVASLVAGAPVIDGAPPLTVVAGQSYSFQPTASDPASKSLTFSIANAPSWAKLNTTTGALSGSPTAAQQGMYPNIVITASDGSLSTSLPAFTITVTGSSAPDAPVIGGTPAASVVAGQAYSFQPTSSDPQGGALQFSIVNRPTWASFDSATGRLSGTPTAAETGSYPGILISVGDGSSSASLPAFSIVVANAAPVGAPTISGSPQNAVVVGDAYRFTPTATDPSGGKLTFSIKNAPSWASFNSATGELTGTPTASDVGTYANIIISVTDGNTSASLPAFPIAVTENASGSVTLDWVAPTENVDGTPLTNLAGYYITYGSSANAMTKTVQVSNPGVLTYVLSNLSPGTWYFAVTAYTTADVQSAQSAVASDSVR